MGSPMNATVHVTIDAQRGRGARGRHGARRREPPRHRRCPSSARIRTARRSAPAAPASSTSRGSAGFPRACHLPARDGMVGAHRHTRRPRACAEAVLDLTLLDARRRRRPRRLRPARRGGGAPRAGRRRPGRRSTVRAVDDSKSFFVLDREACILCGRCTTACDDVQQIGAISLLGRGHDDAGRRLRRRPHGVVDLHLLRAVRGHLPHRRPPPEGGAGPDRAARRDDLPVLRRGLRHQAARCATTGGSPCMADDVPANRSSEGMLCVKGRFGTGFVHSPRPDHHADGQARRALARRSPGTRRSTPPPTGWRGTAGRFGALASRQGHQRGRLRHPEALPRLVMGTNNVDHCTRLCHSPSVEAMLASMGSGATSNSYSGLRGGRLPHGGRARTPRANHPVIADPLPPRRDAAGRALIVVNPKRVELCDQADLWIQPAPRHRRRPLQRDGAGHPRRGPGRRGLRPRAHRGVRRVGASLEPLHARARRGPHRRAGRGHRPGRPLVRAAAVRRAPASSGAWASPSTSTAPPTPTRC